MKKLFHYINIQNALTPFLLGVFLFSFVPIYAKAPFLTSKELGFPPPRIIRTCCSFGTDLSVAGIPFIKKTDIISIEDIGQHHFLGSKNEGNGNIYTRRGGFIDLGHLRDCADWTAYLYNRIIANQENDKQFIIDLGTEGGSKTLILKIPPGFDTINTDELAGKIAYDLSLWHEIATWFGVSYIPLIPERYSSFSPEDLYSNLLGVTLGIRAIKSDLDYNEAMTQLIVNTLDSMETVTSLAETYTAMEDVEAIWWTREKHLPSKKILIKRYFDSDACLIPWLVPDMGNEETPCELNKPEDKLSDLFELRIKLNYKFPLKSILSPQIGRTITQKDFGKFIRYIMLDENSLATKMTRHQLRQNRREQRQLL